ncbi:uncharacterized protein LOC106153161 [Lingula anatina]|uniref:Uncharacterized protein LOC106153161 n=1 Tax=Lingula anatina TaxID=7574 RepID=A0A1S3H8V9_LINAN|nr:uncharacterized protein LOC106153161 [Lingula anatina]|eukprot:XP_013382437.1 uncharacterized protein LOC106153161 [Lingula anatina]
MLYEPADHLQLYSLLNGYQYTESFSVTDDVQDQFNKNGFIILRQLLDTEEITKLRVALEQDQGLRDHCNAADDGEGRAAKSTLWNYVADDITGIIARSEKVAGTMEKLLGGEVYHYHSKVIMKEPFTGGAHIWHQDYGYWYLNGCLFPDMGTVWVAVDRADKTNGCLKILPGSHLAGRVDHVKKGMQAGADVARVEQLMQVCPMTYVQLDPGDALFFHCNLLHRSEQNNSPNRRWAFLMCYNRRTNDPVYRHHHPNYTPLFKVPNSRIKQCSTITTMEGKGFHAGPKATMHMAKLEEQGKEQ